MTKQEWHECSEPQPMLEFLRGKASERKLRLFMVGCCHRFLPFLLHQHIGIAIDLAEKFADGLVNEIERCNVLFEVEEAHEESSDNSDPLKFPGVQRWLLYSVTRAVWNALSTEQDRSAEWGVGFREDPSKEMTAIIVSYESAMGIGFIKSEENDDPDPSELSVHCSFLRDIFGNPFRTVAFDPAWRTPTVTAVAQTIYAERRFTDLPILADALEEAGCSSVDLLGHCRKGGEHVLGCWALDLILGRK